MKELEIVRKDISPMQVKFFGLLIVLATNYKFLTFTFYEVNPWVFVIGNLVAFAIWSAKDVLIIDLEKRQVKEGFKIFGLRHTDRTEYTGFEKIYINKVNTGETFRQMTRTMTIHHENYKAFLKTYDGDKYWIFANSDKDKLIKKLRVLNENLKIEIYDNTVPEQVRID